MLTSKRRPPLFGFVGKKEKEIKEVSEMAEKFLHKSLKRAACRNDKENVRG
jgi:hypothetical protein